MYLAKGCRQEEIAQLMGTNRHIVHRDIARIYAKTGTDNAPSAAVWACENGYVGDTFVKMQSEVWALRKDIAELREQLAAKTA